MLRKKERKDVRFYMSMFRMQAEFFLCSEMIIKALFKIGSM